MSKILKLIIFLGVAGVLIYTFRFPLENLLIVLSSKYFPCKQPISYTVQSFDTRFGISKADFLKAVGEAERIWEKPIGKELFIYKPEGSLKINLIYDFRQEATAKLKKLGLAVSDDKTSYDAIKSRYNSMQASYLEDKGQLESQIAAFEDQKKSYDAEVAYWNKRGGAPKDVYTKLSAERALLNEELLKIKQLQENFNAKVDNINALVVVLNHLVQSLNLDVARYNEVGTATSGEFEEGTYQSGPNGQEIDIYQFDDRQKLVRVLAHELGHALELEHLANPKAIMYRLNEGVNEKLTADDLSELKKHCRIK